MDESDSDLGFELNIQNFPFYFPSHFLRCLAGQVSQKKLQETGLLITPFVFYLFVYSSLEWVLLMDELESDLGFEWLF